MPILVFGVFVPFFLSAQCSLYEATSYSTRLARIFHELLSRDHETGNPLAGLSGAQRARIRWACLPVMRARRGGRATWQPQGVGSEAYLNGTSQGPTPEDARKDGHIRGRSK